MKRIKKMLFALLIIFVLSPVVSAKVTNFDDNVKESGEYNSSLFVGGNTITNKAKVKGIAVLLGNIINSKGTVEYGVYAGNTINISDETEKDLFIAGNDININEEAKVPRDVYIAGNSVNIFTNIGRNLNVAASIVDISGVKINGDAYIYAEKVIMDKDTEITGKLSYDEETKIENLKDAKIGKIQVQKNPSLNIERSSKTKILDVILSIVSGYVIMVIIMSIFPKLRKATKEYEVSIKNTTLDILKGLAVLVGVPIVSVLIILTIVLVPFSVISLMLYGISIYLSFLFAYYMIGKSLIKIVSKKCNIYLELLVSIVLLNLITLIPVIGGVIKALCLFYGLGIILSLILSQTFIKKEQ